MIDQFIAIAVVVTCVVLLARMAIGERQRRRLDASLRLAWDTAHRLFRRLLRRGPSRAEAERAAREAIRRARERRNKLH